MRPPLHNAIDKEDDLETAWDKVKNGLLYQYINNGSMDHVVWKDNLRKMILYVLKAVTT